MELFFIASFRNFSFVHNISIFSAIDRNLFLNFRCEILHNQYPLQRIQSLKSEKPYLNLTLRSNLQSLGSNKGEIQFQQNLLK